MKEHGTLFQLSMVTALLADLKTQTRRVCKPQFECAPVDVIDGVPSWDCPTNYDGEVQMNTTRGPVCPYGVPGDRIWVRETFYAFGRWETRYSAKKGRDEWHFVDLTIEAGFKHLFEAPAQWKRSKREIVTPTWWKRPAIFMPRVASRITLEITDVRVERLQDISESDARAEGIHSYEHFWREAEYFLENVAYEPVKGWPIRYSSAKAAYQALWESINGDGSWDLNPFVWVVEFKVIKP